MATFHQARWGFLVLAPVAALYSWALWYSPSLGLLERSVLAALSPLILVLIWAMSR